MKRAKPFLLTARPVLILAVLMTVIFVLFIGSKSHTLDNLVKACDTTKEHVSKTQCWDSLVRASVRKMGVDRTLELISLLYVHDGRFIQSCHAMTHIVGQAAYARFTSEGDIPLSDKTAYCSFGFFHGFMETLIAKKGTISEARTFCNSIDSKLGKVIPNAKLGCYHGIGHGSTDVHNPKYYGDERALIAPAITNCEAFAQSPEQLKICVTGIFDSISIAYYNNNTNGLTIKKNDPLWLCREQKNVYKEPCYLDMMPAILWFGEYDLARALPLVLVHAEEAYRDIAIRSLSQASVRFVIEKNEAKNYIPVCRSVSAPYILTCIAGLAEGMMQFGEPDKEYIRALDFCGNSGLSNAERTVCMKAVLAYVMSRYPEGKVKTVCDEVEREYTQFCKI